MTDTPSPEPAGPTNPLADMSFDTMYSLVRRARQYLDPISRDYRAAPPERKDGDLAAHDVKDWPAQVEAFRTQWEQQPQSVRETMLARAFPPGPRQCYWISGLDMDADQTGFIPALVVENEPGYSLMAGNGPFASPWLWGSTLDKAEAVCQQVNRETYYLEPDEANEIVISSMNASRDTDDE